MIYDHVKPISSFVKFVPATERRGALQATIDLYAEPKMTTANHAIFSTVIIKEQEAGSTSYTKPYGTFYFQTIMTDGEIKQIFEDILKDPEKFRTA